MCMKQSEVHFKKARKLLVLGTILLVLPPVGIVLIVQGINEHEIGTTYKRLEDAKEMVSEVNKLNADENA